MGRVATLMAVLPGDNGGDGTIYLDAHYAASTPPAARSSSSGTSVAPTVVR
jgi:hypothetical protein